MPNGEYAVIMDLVKLLPAGHTAKKYLDCAVDECGAFLNLRSSIHQAHGEALNAAAQEKLGEPARRGR